MEIDVRPQLKISDEFKELCSEIASFGKSDAEWHEVESCDMFQTDNFCGGFDGCEDEFWFSYYDSDGKEWWLHFSLADIPRVLSGTLAYLDLYEPTD